LIESFGDNGRDFDSVDDDIGGDCDLFRNADVKVF
jgi:hypothetical protein